MFGWHHGLNGHEFEQIVGDSVGQGSVACFSPQDGKESDMTEQQLTTTVVQYPPQIHVNSKHQNMLFFGNRVLTEMIKFHILICHYPKSSDQYSYQESSHTEAQRRWQCEDTGRGQSQVATSQNCQEQSKAEKSKEQYSYRDFRESMTLLLASLILYFWPPKHVREYISVVCLPVVEICYNNLQK